MNNADTPQTKQADNRKLLKAAAIGSAEAIRDMVSKQDLSWGAALLVATQKGHPECVALLLKHSDEDDRGDALVGSGAANRVLCMRLLIEAGCSIGKRNLALRKAATQGHTEYVKAILPFAEAEHETLWPAEVASLNGHASCLELLLPGNPNEYLNDHILIGAAEHGHLECVNLLLARNGCLKEARLGALCAALDNNQNKVVNRLLGDADTAIQCKKSVNPILDSITADNHAALATLLPLCEKDTIAPHYDEMLFLSVRNKTAKCLEILLRKSSACPTAEHLLEAVINDNEPCVKVLAPVVDLNSEKQWLVSNSADHPLVRACFLGSHKLIPFLAPHVSNKSIINAALAAIAMELISDSGALHKSLIPLLQKTTYGGLQRTLKEAPCYLKNNETGLLDGRRDAQRVLPSLKRAFEILERNEAFPGRNSVRKKRSIRSRAL